MTRWPVLGRYAAILAAAAFLTALSFPRTDWSLTPWLMVTPLLVIAILTPPRAAFWWSWLYGGVFFLVLLRWLNFTFRVYSSIPGPLVLLPTALLAGYCALWIAGIGWAVSRIATRWSIGWALGLAPFFWVAAEWLRGHVLGGFPWGTLGYSQYLHLHVIQIAELTGVHGVSFLLVAVNAALAGCLLLTWRRAVAASMARSWAPGTRRRTCGLRRLKSHTTFAARPWPGTSPSLGGLAPTFRCKAQRRWCVVSTGCMARR